MKAKISFNEGGALIIKRGDNAVCVPKGQLDELRAVLAEPQPVVRRWASKARWVPERREQSATELI